VGWAFLKKNTGFFWTLLLGSIPASPHIIYHSMVSRWRQAYSYCCWYITTQTNDSFSAAAAAAWARKWISVLRKLAHNFPGQLLVSCRLKELITHACIHYESATAHKWNNLPPRYYILKHYTLTTQSKAIANIIWQACSEQGGGCDGFNWTPPHPSAKMRKRWKQVKRNVTTRCDFQAGNA